MLNFSLDRFACGVIVAGCSLLILPDWALGAGYWPLLAGVVLWRRQAAFWSRLLVAGAFFHWQAAGLSRLADGVSQLPLQAEFEFDIVEIVHQQEYQTLVIEAVIEPENVKRRIYTTWNLPERPQAGERWRGVLVLRPLSSRLNQGGFDRQKWAFAKGISAQGKVKSAVKIGEDFSWRQRRLQQAQQQTQNLAQQGLLLALAFGERAWLPNADWRSYQQSNTAHLIAISGLHIRLAMSLGFALLRLGQFVLPTRWISPYLPWFGGLALAAAYSLLAGFSIPTFRAMAALSVVALCRLGRGYCTPWQLFVRTVALLLLCDPLMILSDSFWLSVGAVGCLILWYQLFPLTLLQWRGLALRYSPWHRLRYVLGLLHLQFGLLWLFSPIQLLIFNGMSLHSFWANLIAVPLFSLLLVPLVLFAVFSQGAMGSWHWADGLAAWIGEIVRHFDQGWIFFFVQHSAGLSLGLAAALLFALYGVYGRTKKSAISTALFWANSGFPISLNPERRLPKQTLLTLYAACMALILICGAVLAGQRWQQAQTWRLESLDVGQGLALLLLKNGRGLLYDTGAAWAGGSMAELEILPYLRRQGIELEQLVLSHDDNDHAGGAAALIAAFPNLQLRQSSTKNYGKIDRTFCVQGENWQWQGLDFKVLQPVKVVERAENGDSCVLLVSDGRHRILLTGDADLAAERRFAPGLGKIDVLQVGHHGSKTSTGDLLLAQSRPTVALISSGRWNPWKMPHQTVLARLEAGQAAVYNSAEVGQVSLIFSQNGYQIRTARHKFSPWYRRIVG